jgi:hypothetical protein
MREMKYVLHKKINGEIMSIELNADEVRAVGEYYDEVMLADRVWLKLEFELGVKPEDFHMFEEIVSDIIAAYEKNREYGCDDQFSMDEAINDHSDRIEALMTE